MVIESANSIFKEVSREHEYGHDAFLLLVDDEEVLPVEFALQIKSGKSFCRPESCVVRATISQIEFWEKHPMVTLGIVFDPTEECAYWTDFKQAARDLELKVGQKTAQIVFKKSEWNRFDQRSFESIFIPLLTGRPPAIELERAQSWAGSAEFDLHELGVQSLLRLYRDKKSVWDTFFELFMSRPVSETSNHLVWAIAHIPTHYDILPNFSTGVIPDTVRSEGMRKLSKLGESDVIKLLSFVDDYGFSRGGIGQSVGAIISAVDGYAEILERIRNDNSLNPIVRDCASFLVEEGIGYPMLPRSEAGRTDGILIG